MSLIGSLEDLNLGDILQIIYLSQKSGVLVIRSAECEGRIVFRDGLVCGGSTEGTPADLRCLLVDAGHVDSAAFNDVAASCASDGSDLEAALATRELIGADRIDELRRASIEAAVGDMFRWQTGEFSFDLQRDEEAANARMTLGKGINPQFLAMERVRLEDESGRGGELEDDGDRDPGEMSAEEMFGVVSAEPEPSTPAVAAEPVPAEAHAIAGDVAGEEGELLEADLLEPVSTLLEPSDSPERPQTPPASQAVARESSPAPSIQAPSGPIIVIDDDLVVLEWTKKALKGAIEQIHIFQRSDLGLNRIRQYLGRGVTPMVLLSPEIAGDPSGGIKDASDFVRRLKTQSSGIRVLWLCEEGGSGPPPSNPADGVLSRPATRDFRSPGAVRNIERHTEALREALTGGASARSTPRPAEAAAESPAPSGQAGLGEIERSLAEASSRGEVLPLVIRFARETFSRVAMFMVRDGNVMGIAQSGLEACGGPDDHGMRGLTLEAEDCSWLNDVLTSRRPRVAEPSDHGDFKLAALLGDRSPEEAYLAPIQSGDQVVALLYADNLPGGEPIGDTTRVEAALEQAGAAFERALRERTQHDEAS